MDRSLMNQKNWNEKKNLIQRSNLIYRSTYKQTPFIEKLLAFFLPR